MPENIQKAVFDAFPRNAVEDELMMSVCTHFFSLLNGAALFLVFLAAQQKAAMQLKN